MSETIKTITPEETFEVGVHLGSTLKGGEVVLLYGGLGAGKTLFTKGVLHALDFDIDEVTSPSFTLVNLYKTATFDVYHIDLWRLDAAQDVAMGVGLDEILESENAVTIIEWAERLGEYKFPSEPIRVTLEGDGEEPRRIAITRPDDATRIIIRKAARELAVVKNGETVKTYRIVMGFTPVGDKEVEGDGKTPEGEFYVFTKNEDSKYFLSLGISYPSAEDAARGLATGLISRDEHDAIVTANRTLKTPPQKTALGGGVYIHGGGVEKDWTWGCTAVENKDMREIFDAVEVGTPIMILP